MRRLILVKHSFPSIDPDVPWDDWLLSEEGCRLCLPLTDRLATYEPSTILSSTETKARETAALVADRLGLSASALDGLQENDRAGLGIVSPDELHGVIAEFFSRPDEFMIGRETALQALDRFSRTVRQVTAEHPEGNIVVVAHGAVITLFVSAHNNIDPYSFWRSLGLPSFVVLSLPDFGLLETVRAIE